VRGEDTLAEFRGVGGSIVRKTPDTALYSIYVIVDFTICFSFPRTKVQFNMFVNCNNRNRKNFLCNNLKKHCFPEFVSGPPVGEKNREEEDQKVSDAPISKDKKKSE
jgi:hypothetical protein